MQNAKTDRRHRLSRTDGIISEIRNEQGLPFKRSRAVHVRFGALADYVKVSMDSIGRISRHRNQLGSRSSK